MTACVEIENMSCVPDHAHFRGGLSSESWVSIYSTCAHNLTALASAVSEILLGGRKI